MAFAKTICSICYEDLKPIVEDLQAISICGHVFHELCLQQWFEYCTNPKKHTCPFCKQCCSLKNVGRLYFQSIGEVADSAAVSQSQNRVDSNESAEVMRIEVKKLEAMVAGLNLALDQHQKEATQLAEELRLCKDQLTNEGIRKRDALKQKEFLQAVLESKSSELLRSTMECSRLQETNLALAKELAALKLVSDCNLEEEEVMKLASLGNDGNGQDTVDVLKKSLVIRNKSYKELMAKCNTLGRGEARFKRKLERAKEKIMKLKMRVHELELAIETKENEVLRELKASKKRLCNEQATLGVKSSKSSFIFNHMTLEREDQPPPSVINVDDGGNNCNDICGAKETNNKDIGINDVMGDGTVSLTGIRGHDRSINDDSIVKSKTTHDHSAEAKTTNITTPQNSKMPREAACDSNKEAKAQQANNLSSISSLRTGLSNSIVNDCSAAEEDEIMLLDDIRHISPPTKTEASPPFLLARPGDGCFAGGLLGSDGANRYLGRWCKRVQSKGSMESSRTMQGSNSNAGNLIAVGADGFGGRIKVLRSTNQSFMDGKENSMWSKRSKLVAKTSSLKSQGCMQIEHFFGKATYN